MAYYPNGRLVDFLWVSTEALNQKAVYAIPTKPVPDTLLGLISLRIAVV